MANNLGQSEEGGSKDLMLPTESQAYVRVGWDDIRQLHEYCVSRGNNTLSDRQNYNNVIHRMDNNANKMRQLPVINLFDRRFGEYLWNVLTGNMHLRRY
jgi:hypothetical protein